MWRSSGKVESISSAVSSIEQDSKKNAALVSGSGVSSKKKLFDGASFYLTRTSI